MYLIEGQIKMHFVSWMLSASGMAMDLELNGSGFNSRYNIFFKLHLSIGVMSQDMADDGQTLMPSMDIFLN